MLRIAALISIVACLAVISCQPPEGMAGVTKEEYDALMKKVEMLEGDMATMQEAMDGFIEQYNMHIEKHHKGGTTVPKPAAPKPGGVKPPTQK